jgi:predicted secreted protein
MHEMTSRHSGAFLAALCLALTGCASNQYPGAPEEMSLRLEERDAGRSVELQRGKRVTLRLEANRSAGYRWSLAESGDGGLEQIGEPYYAVEKAVPGGGGAEYWTFRATRAGQKALRFEYRRPWESDKPAAKGLSYTINVR